MADTSFQLFKSFSDELDLKKLQVKFLDALLNLQNVERGSLWIQDGDEYFCIEAAGPQSDTIKGVRIGKGESSIVGWVIENGKMAIADPRHDGRHYSGIEEKLTIKSSLILSYPLFLKEKDVYGAVQIIDTTPEKYRINLNEDYLNYVQNLVDIGSIALSNAIQFAKQQDETNSLKKALETIQSEGIIIGHSPDFVDALELSKSYANSDFPVLITGESGTGKELMAERIHKLSDRKNMPFLAQNCSTIPENLLESELFGYKKGAFSGANKDRTGLFEAGDGGTVFLDEIGDMPFNLQASILRVIQNNEIKPLGANAVKKIDVRIISATNIDIVKSIEDESFRQDLYYRLSVLPLALPPLRARKGDIPLLINHFMKRESARLGVSMKELSLEAIELLIDHSWPGNIRELENLVRYLLVSFRKNRIEISDLPKTIMESYPSSPSLSKADTTRPEPAAYPGNQAPMIASVRQLTYEEMEKFYVNEILKKNNWNVTKAAKDAGVNRSTFASRIRRLGISREDIEYK